MLIEMFLLKRPVSYFRHIRTENHWIKNGSSVNSVETQQHKEKLDSLKEKDFLC